MARITWNSIGERFYETGVDRGVLYVGANPGVPWPGLMAVSENPSGGEARAFYFDGIKYLNISAAEEFAATINALSSPSAFSVCDGEARIHNGLIATQQPRKSFGLSYRTKIGNDLDGPDHSYKIHIVYNALAEPTQKTRTSLGGPTEPSRLSWNITTKPEPVTDYKPTAHLIIDARQTPADVLSAIEDILYGDDLTSSRLPDPDEIIALYEA